MKSSYYSIVALLLVAQACTKEIPFEGDTDEERLVLNAILEVDSTFSVSLERSIFFLEDNTPENTHVVDAEIIVNNLSSGETFTLEETAVGSIYSTNEKVLENTEYSIEIKHPDYDNVSAETTILTETKISSLDTVSYITSDSENRIRYIMKWDDPPNEDNYYMVRGRIIDVSSNNIEPLYISSKDPIIYNLSTMNINETNNHETSFIFADETFNGSTKELTFSSNKPSSLEDPNNTDANIELSLISMDRNTFLYLQSVFLYDQTDFLSEPVKIHSNIEEGFGIFGFFNHSVIEL